LITRKDELSLEKLREIKPRYIFFSHMSYIVKGQDSRLKEEKLFVKRDALSV